MDFYNRESELDILNRTYHQATEVAQMVVITGRRRIGKTMLSLTYVADKPHLYLFVAKKAEHLLCQEYLAEIKQKFDVPIIGEIQSFKDIFALLLEISKQQQFVLIIDEFQEFHNINSSIYSDIQRLWDLNKAKSKMQVLLMGSVYSMMHKLFKDSKEPLFGREDYSLHLRPFSPHEIYHILCQHHKADVENLFAYYLFTGGVPKYVDILIRNKCFDELAIIDFMLSPQSPLLDEGKDVLIEEFGKEYGIYFSILQLLSSGKTSRGEIESLLEKDIGGYLERLDKDYNVIDKLKPINAKLRAKVQKYQIKDRFLQFWFRYIYKHKSAVETGNFDYIKRLLERDLSGYKGRILESFFKDLFADSHQYNLIGSYWERDGSNEIDLVAINELDKKMVIGEVKLNKDKISLGVLKSKSTKLVQTYKDFDIEYVALSLEDAIDYLK